MGYTKFALICFVLIATAALGNCQSLTGQPTVNVLGVVNCGVSLRSLTTPVNVSLSCDNGATVLARGTTNVLGLFRIGVEGVTATLIDPSRCAVFVNTSVAECRLNTGEVLRAPLVLVNQILPPLLSFTRFFIATVFSVVTIR